MQTNNQTTATRAELESVFDALGAAFSSGQLNGPLDMRLTGALRIVGNKIKEIDAERERQGVLLINEHMLRREQRV